MNIRNMSYRSASNSLVVGVLQLVGGGLLSAASALLYFTSRLMEAMTNMGISISRFFLFLLWGGLALIIRGIWNCYVQGKYKKLMKAVSQTPNITIEQVSQALNNTQQGALSDIERTLNRRYWRGFGLSETSMSLVEPGNKIITIMASPNMMFKESKKPNMSVPAWISVAIWVTYITFAQFPFGFGMFMALGLTVLSVILFPIVLPKKTRLQQVQQVVVPTFEEQPVQTGNANVDEVLATGLAQLQQLSELDRTITTGKIDGQVQEMLHVARQIFDHVKKNPEKLGQIRQFMNYYLPTTIKLLNSYVELNRQPVKGDNITEAMTKIEGIMEDILVTFRKQLDDLYRDNSIDISADIAVMENMIHQPGFDLLSFSNKK